MNLTHIHLLLNHFPIAGTLIGSTILLYSIKGQNTATAWIEYRGKKNRHPDTSTHLLQIGPATNYQTENGE